MSDPERHDPDGLQLCLLVDLKGALVLSVAFLLVSVIGWHIVLIGAILASLVIEGYSLFLTAGVLRRRFRMGLAPVALTAGN